MTPLASALDAALRSPFFGISLTLAAFLLGKALSARLRWTIVNPFVVAIFTIIAFLTLCDIPLSYYEAGGDILSLMLVPATAILGVSVFNRRALLRENLLPILAGCGVGTLVSIGSVYGLCRLFGLDETLMHSLLPKSVTTPIAIELAEIAGGIVPLAIAAVAVTGVTGVVCLPPLLRRLRIDDPVTAGVAIGVSSHALGTARAVELGETEAAASGIALCVTGVLTAAVFLWLFA